MASIGIDLGTTYSCVSMYKNGRAEVFPNKTGNKTTPSIVSFKSDSEPEVGEAAKELLPNNPENTVYDAKRMLGRTFDDKHIQNDMKKWPFKVIKGLRDRPKISVTDRGKKKELFPEEISAEVLKHLLNIAREKSRNNELKDAVITVPAYFTDAQRKSTKEAGRLAGINVLSIITEPVAAAIAFGINVDESDDHTVLVFDLGGGTFDVSILTIEDNVFEVKSIIGDDHLGGQDFDNEIVNYLISEFKKQTGLDVSGLKRETMLLKLEAEKAKKNLSAITKAVILIEKFYRGKDLKVTLTRQKFEEINKVHFDKLIPLVRKAIDNCDIDKDDITDILLVGGSSRIPCVQSLIKEEFPMIKACATVNPDEAVAIGASIRAYNLAHADDEDEDSEGYLVLCDACPMTKGIEIEGEKMEPLIHLNDIIPKSVTKEYTTTYDYQEAIGILIFEGEDKKTKFNHFLGQFNIEIPKKKKGEVKIAVTFSLTAESILEVKADVDDGRIVNGKVIRLSDELAPGKPVRTIRVEGKTNKVDILFCIDATGSMGPWLNAAKERAESIATAAKRENPSVEFRFGVVFYRDPVADPRDKNVYYDFTTDIAMLKANMATQTPYGGGCDGPEDWVGCYNLALNSVSWDPKSSKAIIHITDASAHGTVWGDNETKIRHDEEAPKLDNYIRECAKKDIFFQGISINEYAMRSFNRVKKLYSDCGKTNVKIADFKAASGVSAADFLQNIAHDVILAIAPK